MEDDDLGDDTHGRQLLLAEIQGIGVPPPDGSRFIKSESCNYSLRQIMRILYTERPTGRVEKRSLFRLLGEVQIMQKYLLPLLIAYRDDPLVVFDVVRLIAMLTIPLPESPRLPDHDDQLLTLQMYGQAFLEQSDALAVLMKYLQLPLSVPASQRTVRHNQLLELLLTLFRSLLLIPDALPNTRHTYLIDFHDKLVLRFHEEHILETVVLLSQFAGQESNSTHHLLLLDVLHAVFRNETPVSMFPQKKSATTAATVSTVAPSVTPSGTLTSSKSAAAQRLEAAKANVEKHSSSRHHNFGGTIVINRMGGAKQLVSSVFANTDRMPNAQAKVRVNKKSVPAPELQQMRTAHQMSEPVRQALYQTAVDFLLNGYRELMSLAFKSFTLRAAGVTSDDKANYMRLSAFFLEFHRLYFKMQAALVSKEAAASGTAATATGAVDGVAVTPGASTDYDASIIFFALNLESFNWVLSHIRLYADEDKKNVVWRSVLLAVNMYRQMMVCIYEMTNRGDADNKQIADLLLRNVFYERETLSMLATMVKVYQPNWAPKEYLAQLIEIVHYVLHMLKDLGKRQPNFLMLDKKRKVTKRAKSKKDKKDKKQQEAEEEEEKAENAEEKPAEAEQAPVADAQNDAAAKENTEPEAQPVVPAAAESQALGSLPQAENMFETQPEGLVPDVQQDPVQQLDAEMAAQEPESATNTDAVNPANAEAEAAKQGEEGKGDEESSDDEEEEEESEEDSEDDGVPRFMQRESVLKFESQLAEFSNANIVRHYMFLLEDYRTNSAALNAYLLRFLERIAVDLKLPATFYQLKFFVTFDTILNDASIRTDAAFVKLRTFAKMIARQYFDALSKNSLMVVHALFKHSRHDLEDLQNPGARAAAAAAKAAEREARIKESQHRKLQATLQRSANLSLAHQLEGIDPADNIPRDVVYDDVDDEEEADLGAAGLIRSESSMRRKKRAPGAGRWTTESDDLLRAHYPTHKDNRDCLLTLAAMLPPGRAPAAVRARLKKLGLFEDNGVRMRLRENGASESDDSSSGDDEGSGSEEEVIDEEAMAERAKHKQEKRERKEAKRLARQQRKASKKKQRRSSDEEDDDAEDDADEPEDGGDNQQSEQSDQEESADAGDDGEKGDAERAARKQAKAEKRAQKEARRREKDERRKLKKQAKKAAKKAQQSTDQEVDEDEAQSDHEEDDEQQLDKSQPSQNDEQHSADSDAESAMDQVETSTRKRKESPVHHSDAESNGDEEMEFGGTQAANSQDSDSEKRDKKHKHKKSKKDKKDKKDKKEKKEKKEKKKKHDSDVDESDDQPKKRLRRLEKSVQVADYDDDDPWAESQPSTRFARLFQDDDALVPQSAAAPLDADEFFAAPVSFPVVAPALTSPSRAHTSASDFVDDVLDISMDDADPMLTAAMAVASRNLNDSPALASGLGLGLNLPGHGDVNDAYAPRSPKLRGTAVEPVHSRSVFRISYDDEDD